MPVNIVASRPLPYYIKFDSDEINYSIDHFQSAGLNCRKKFLKGFDIMVAKKLQELGVRCWIVAKHNWFRNEKKFKLNSPKWSGVFECFDESCKNRYIHASFKEINLLADNFMVLEFEDQSTHKDFIKKETQRVTGDERSDIATKLIAYGNSNVRNENILSFSNGGIKNPNLFNKNILKTIKFEASHKLRYSNKITDDIEASKVITDELCGKFGYFQTINLNPFGFLLLCELQVRILD